MRSEVKFKDNMQRDALFRGIPLFGTVMGEEWFAPWGYVAFRNIPVGIEGAASLWSKGVRNLREIISPDGVVYCHPIFQGKSFFKAYHTYTGVS